MGLPGSLANVPLPAGSILIRSRFSGSRSFLSPLLSQFVLSDSPGPIGAATIYVAATHNVGLPQDLRNRARKRRLFPDTFGLPRSRAGNGTNPWSQHPFVVQINSR